MGIVAARRLASLTVGELSDSFEHRVRELGPAVPRSELVDYTGLYAGEE